MYVNVFSLFSFVCLCIKSCSLQDTNAAQDADPILTIINGDGYEAEVYEVTTGDGYILSLYRIPPKEQTSKVAFLMHGMILSAVDFLVLGPHENTALGYALSNAGYDVWFANARGTKFSKKHSNINSNDNEYWQFSWHEIGLYDVPACIDHILAKTGQKSLHYISHSQGATVLFVMLSLLPAYNEKIKTFHGMTPVMRISHPCPLAQFLAANVDEIQQTLSTFNFNELPTSTGDAENMAGMFCKEGAPFAHLCSFAMFAFFGKSPQQFNGTLLAGVLKHVPAGMGLRQLYHFLQLINAKKFQMYDYKIEDNLMKYKSETPPEYQTSNIQLKMQILYGTHDLLAQPEDVEDLIHYFGHQVADVVKLDGWNHVDFIYGKNVNKMVYQRIIKFMEEYKM